MVYGLKYTRTFKKQIDRAKKKDKALVEELVKKVRKLQESPYSGKPLKHRLSQYRSLRVKGKYRLIYTVDENESEVVLAAFGHREEVYELTFFSYLSE